jgi:hypothetical protein
LAEVMRKANPGVKVEGNPSVVLTFGAATGPKPTWTAAWGSAFSNSNIPDDCGPP